MYKEPVNFVFELTERVYIVAEEIKEDPIEVWLRKNQAVNSSSTV